VDKDAIFVVTLLGDNDRLGDFDSSLGDEEDETEEYS
jgi:hypothetical protein